MGEAGLRFAGHAALFDRVDRGGDVIRAGAFADCLARGGGRMVLLLEHDLARPVGFVTAREDARGLAVEGRLTARTGTARAAARLVESGALRGLSFGYRVVAARGARPRELLALDVVEVSLVARPMQPGAGVEDVVQGAVAAAIL